MYGTVQTFNGRDGYPLMGGEGDNTPGGNAPNTDTDRSASTVMDDAGITASVKAKLLADSDVSGLKIDMDTRSGVVYLTGDNMKSQSSSVPTLSAGCVVTACNQRDFP